MTAIDTGTALLRAIITDPAEDTPRLAYADWLDEQGDAGRAEFVRVQVALAALRAVEPTGSDPAYLAGWRTAYWRNLHHLAAICGTPCGCGRCLERREWELLLSRAGDAVAWLVWAGPACALVPTGARYDDHLTYRRGFVDEVTCDLAILFGGPCLRCEGYYYDRDCPACGSTGRVAGCAAELFAAQPVTEIRLSHLPDLVTVHEDGDTPLVGTGGGPWFRLADVEAAADRRRGDVAARQFCTPDELAAAWRLLLVDHGRSLVPWGSHYVCGECGGGGLAGVRPNGGGIDCPACDGKGRRGLPPLGA